MGRSYDCASIALAHTNVNDLPSGPAGSASILILAGYCLSDDSDEEVSCPSEGSVGDESFESDDLDEEASFGSDGADEDESFASDASALELSESLSFHLRVTDFCEDLETLTFSDCDWPS